VKKQGYPIFLGNEEGAVFVVGFAPGTTENK